MNSIPNNYAGFEIKSRLIKNKELTLHRTVNADVLQKTTNEWTNPKMIRMVLDEKKKQRLAEIQKQKKELLTKKLIQ